MQIKIVDYKPEWQQEYSDMAKRLRRAAGESVQRIDHIGSTSVDGLAAKDVIDIQVTVSDLEDPAPVEKLERAGFRLRNAVASDALVGIDENGDSDSKELRKRYFREPEGDRRTHIHVREAGRVNQRYALLFRDYLRSNPSARRAYELVKRRLAEVFPDDVDGCYAIKDPLMDVNFLGADHWSVIEKWSPDNDCH